MKSKRGGLQFGWIFAVIVGAVFLFMAFYFVGQLMMEERIEKGTIATRSLDIIITPLSFLGELGATTAKPIDLREASKIELGCDSKGHLGSSSILLVGERTTKYEAGHPKISYDKYLLGEDLNETFEKRFQTLTKSVYIPWRVADLTMLWPADRYYCFVKAPERIEKELEKFNISSINFTETEDACDYESITVCFYGGRGCNIHVTGASREGVGTVTKRSGTLNYANDTLLYAAIFSDPGLYKCNLQRIAKRLNLEIEVFQEKAASLREKGCPSFSLEGLQAEATTIVSDPGRSLAGLWSAALSVKSTNDYAACKLF